MDFLSKRILGRLNWIRGRILLRVLFLRRWLRRGRSIRIIEDTISSILWLTGWTSFWRRRGRKRRRKILEKLVRIPAGFIGISHLIVNLSTRSKKYSCIYFPHRGLAPEHEEAWPWGFTSCWLGKVPSSLEDDANWETVQPSFASFSPYEHLSFSPH